MPNATDDDARFQATVEAQELLREDDPDGALRELRALLDADPRNAYAHFYVGAAFAAKGQLGFACAAYEAALAHAPTYLGAAVQRARTLYDLGRDEEALRACRVALDLSPDGEDADTLQVMALTFARIGRRPEAIATLLRYLDRPHLDAEDRFEAESLLKALRGKLDLPADA